VPRRRAINALPAAVDDRTHRRQLLEVGLVTALCLAACATLVWISSERYSPFRHAYRVRVRLETAGELTVGAPVEWRGVRVGWVRALRPGPAGGVEAVLTVLERVGLPATARALVLPHASGRGRYVLLYAEAPRGRLADDGSAVIAGTTPRSLLEAAEALSAADRGGAKGEHP
jgi:ABC-type transporter Mla subunit MlaD